MTSLEDFESLDILGSADALVLMVLRRSMPCDGVNCDASDASDGSSGLADVEVTTMVTMKTTAAMVVALISILNRNCKNVFFGHLSRHTGLRVSLVCNHRKWWWHKW